MTSVVGCNHLPESLSGPCRCLRYHELNTHKVTKSQRGRVRRSSPVELRETLLRGSKVAEEHWFKRKVFYNCLKSKVKLAAAKAAALRINLNVQGCDIVAPPIHAPSRTDLLFPLLLSHNLLTPCVH